MLSQTTRPPLALNRFRKKPKPAIPRLFRNLLNGVKTSAIFLKTCYVDGFRALIAGRYTRPQAAMIIAGNLPTILGALLITFPSVLFPSPEHQAFYHFGSMLSDDPASLIPVLLGTISSTLGLRIPLG